MATRRNTRSRRQRGGMAELTTVEAPSLANAQGNAFRQQGGQAPVGDQGLLEGGLRSSAGLDTLDAATSEIKGMQDGGRRRKGRKNRSASRKGRRATRNGRKNRSATRKGRKNRSSTRKGRKSARRSRQQGGAFGDAAQEVSAPSSLLPADLQKVALGTQSGEWRLAANPNTFKPT